MRKKHFRTFGLILLFTTLSLTACGKGASGKPGEAGQSPTRGIPDIQGGISQKPGQGQQSLALTGKAIGTLPVVGVEDETYCNLPENMTNLSMEEILPICYDPLYGILYYVDYGRDYLIHMIRDGKAELAVELPARRLFCRGGKLYFLLDSYGQFDIEGAESGNILSYNPVDGQVDLVSNQVFDSIVVYQDIIFGVKKEAFGENGATLSTRYIYSFDTGKWNDIKGLGDSDFALDPNCRYQGFFLGSLLQFFDISESEIEDEMARAYYEEYLKQMGEPPRRSSPLEKQLRRWDGGEPTTLNGLGEFASSLTLKHYIKGDYLLWYRSGELHSYHIPGQQDEILASIPQQLDSPCLLVEDRIYGASGNYFDVHTKTLYSSYFLSPDCRPWSVREFYTDGESLYAINMVFSGTSKLYRIREITYEQAREIILDIDAKKPDQLWIAKLADEIKGYDSIFLWEAMNSTSE